MSGFEMLKVEKNEFFLVNSCKRCCILGTTAFLEAYKEF